MKKLLTCAFNMDSGYVELKFSDGSRYIMKRDPHMRNAAKLLMQTALVGQAM